MKITCESCGSKYTIADAKVKGRKVKVRCKGCKESILVDGTQLDASSAEQAEPTDAQVGVAVPGAEALGAEAPRADTWSVNLSDDDSREMTLDELVQGWRSGVVTADAYVWKDGMGDWKPILEVGELKLKLGGALGTGGVVSSAAPAAVAPAGGKMDDLFGGADLTASAPTDKPAGLPGGGAAKPTGARNDSSVLFSLDNIKSGEGSAAQHSGGEDIFGNLGMGAGTLTSNTDLLTAPAKDPPPAPAGARIPLAAAAAPPSSKKGNTGLIVGAIVGVAVLIGGAVFAMGGGDGDGEPSAEEADAAAIAAKEAEEAKKKAEEAKQKAEEERKKLEAMKKELEEKAKEQEKAKEEEKKEEEEEEEEKEAAAASDSGSSSSSSSSSSPTPQKSAPGPFNIGAAKSALVSAAANAAGCKKPGGPTGSGKVQVTFSTSGRVTSAQVVSGPFGGTAVGGCVASTFRRARVPAFSGGPKTVAKSFRIP